MQELQEEEACESQLVRITDIFAINSMEYLLLFRMKAGHCSPRVQNTRDKFGVEWSSTVEFDKYRYETMGSNVVTEIPFYPEEMDTLIFKPDMKSDCNVMKHHFVAWHDYSCMAVVYIQGTNTTYNVVVPSSSSSHALSSSHHHASRDLTTMLMCMD